MKFVVKPPDVTPGPDASESPSQSQAPLPTESQDPGQKEEDDPTPTPVKLERRELVYTCLIFGMDDGYGNTDTIMVATFDVAAKKIGLVSIPRDTVVTLVNSPAFNKVNAAYAQGSTKQLRQEVSQLLGIPIDYYVKVNLAAFERLVDMVGGIYFDVPVDMHYNDPTQDLTIDLTAGFQLLDGQKALQLVRFRQDNTGAGYGDTGRAHTQQEFLKAMLSQVMSGASLTDVPDLVNIVRSYVEIDKNLSVNDMIYFGRELVGMDIGVALRTVTLPADWHSPYMWVKTDEALKVINEMLNPYTTDVTEEMVEFYRP
jgi:LCP family protein required for cell wall assembly